MLIARRLILTSIRAFIINTAVRLLFMLFCTNLFLFPHVYTKPFSSNLLNKVETLSLSMLNIICVLNLFPAYNYSYPMFSYEHTQNFIQMLKSIETALNLIFPSIAGLVLVIFFSVRIFQFIFWLRQRFLRLISFCKKYKFS